MEKFTSDQLLFMQAQDYRKKMADWWTSCLPLDSAHALGDALREHARMSDTLFAMICMLAQRQGVSLDPHAQPKPCEEFLQWPPGAPEIASVYRSRQYIARYEIHAYVVAEGGGFSTRHARASLPEGSELFFDGSSCYRALDGGWFMRVWNDPACSPGTGYWVCAQDIKPGKEIGK